MTYNVFTDQEHLEALDALDTAEAHAWYAGHRLNAWNGDRADWQALIAKLPAERAVDLAAHFANGKPAQIWTYNFETRIQERAEGLTLGRHRETGQWLVALAGNSCNWTPLETFTTTDWLQADWVRRWKAQAAQEAAE